MAKKNEIKNFLKEGNYTEEQIDKYWAELYEINGIVKNLTDSGKDWRELNIHLIKQIPTQKEKDLKSIKEKEDRIKNEELLRIENEKKEKYYNENFENIVVEKIDKREKLTEKEIRRIVRDYEIEEEYGENERWYRFVTSICKLKNRYFAIDWQEGLTEMQTNEYLFQPYEVVLKEYEKLVKIREWVKK